MINRVCWKSGKFMGLLLCLHLTVILAGRTVGNRPQVVANQRDEIVKLSVLPVRSDAYQYPYDIGVPFIRNLTSQAISLQVFSLIQDDRGILYAATNGGIFEYDGNLWSWVNQSPQYCRGMAFSEDGTLYVGFMGDFGYLVFNNKGESCFVSLRSRLPDPKMAIDYLDKVIGTDRGVYFFSKKMILRYYHDTVQVFNQDLKPQFAFLVNGELLVITGQEGILLMQGDQLRPLPGAEELNKLQINSI